MSASNRAAVQRLFIEGLNNRDFSVLTDLFRDCIYHMPLIGELRGEAVSHFYTSLFAAFPDAQRTVEDQVTDDNQTVVTRWTTTGTHLGEFMGIAPTGKRVECPLVVIVHFRDGKLSNEHIYWDQATVLVQIGLLDSSLLPVAGSETAKKLANPSLPANHLIARAKLARKS